MRNSPVPNIMKLYRRFYGDLIMQISNGSVMPVELSGFVLFAGHTSGVTKIEFGYRPKSKRRTTERVLRMATHLRHMCRINFA